MNETEVMIEVRELEKLFSLKGHERMFNNLFRSYGEWFPPITVSGAIHADVLRKVNEIRKGQTN